MTGAAGLSATEVSGLTGVSRVTARRYLEYLVNVDRAARSPRYGTPGRPEVEYRPGAELDLARPPRAVYRCRKCENRRRPAPQEAAVTSRNAERAPEWPTAEPRQPRSWPIVRAYEQLRLR